MLLARDEGPCWAGSVNRPCHVGLPCPWRVLRAQGLQQAQPEGAHLGLRVPPPHGRAAPQPGRSPEPPPGTTQPFSVSCSGRSHTPPGSGTSQGLFLGLEHPFGLEGLGVQCPSALLDCTMWWAQDVLVAASVMALPALLSPSWRPLQEQRPQGMCYLPTGQSEPGPH